MWRKPRGESLRSNLYRNNTEKRLWLDLKLDKTSAQVIIAIIGLMGWLKKLLVYISSLFDVA